MPHRINQEIAHDLPNLRAKFQYLKYTNKSVSKLASEYDAVGREIEDTEKYLENSLYVQSLKSHLEQLKLDLFNKIKG